MKKEWFLLAIILTILVLGFSNLAKAQETHVCCANPGTTIDVGNPQFFCYDSDPNSMLTQDQCCPATGGGYDADLLYPYNQVDCVANFASTACTSLSSCTTGCCYDQTQADPDLTCSARTEYQCLNVRPANSWALGYLISQRLDVNNPCYSSQQDANGAYIPVFASCPVKDSCSEPGYTQSECTQALGCVFCPNIGPTSGAGQCLANCGSCGNYITDNDGDSVCDPSFGHPDCTDLTCGTISQACNCGSQVAYPGQYCCGVLNQVYNQYLDCRDPCFPECWLNRPISDSSILYGEAYIYCKCGMNFVQLTSPGWCCQYPDRTGYNATACYQTGTIRGQILDQDTAATVPGVRVEYDSQFVLTDANGNYEILDLLYETYTLTVSHPNYASAQQNALLTQPVLIVNFILTPSIPFCANPDNQPIDINPRIECSYGEKAFIISWDNPCPSHIIGFTVYRNNNVIASLVESTTFVDTEFQWETNIRYKITPVYDYYVPTYDHLTNTYFSGYSECLDHAGKEICVNNIRHSCSVCNVKEVVQACQIGEVCLGPNNAGRTVCKITQDCLDIGLPLGLFYDPQECYGVFSNANYCYYDYTSTTIDMCMDCSPDLTCYDYRSQEACEVDNCNVGGSSSCVYEPTNPGFGKGICYQQDYSGGENCDLCNEMFMDCDAASCSKLGRCYLSGDTCNRCTTTKCEEYTNQQDCTGGQNYHIDANPNCPAEKITIFSLDTCELGYCKWANSQCFKDADNNNIPDVDLGDYSAPITSVHAPAGVLSEGSEIQIIPNELAHTFYCIDIAGTCCPLNQVQDGKIAIPDAIPAPLRGEGWYFIRYYSEDYYNNAEDIKETRIFVDLLPPAVTLDYNAVDNADYSYKSDLFIEASISESAKCIELLLPETFYDITQTTHFIAGFSTLFSAIYRELFDLIYTYSVYCEDHFGNNATYNFIIDVDKNQVIYDETPLGGLTRETSMHLSLKTTKSGECQYSILDDAGTPTIYTNMGAPQIIGATTYQFDTTLSGLETGLYDIYVYCSGLDWNDTTRLFFTIDREPPVTIFYEQTSSAKLDYSSTKWYSMPSNFVLECLDEPQNLRAPGEPFGCDESQWCSCRPEGCTCTPNIPSADITASQSSTICYRSIDEGGNIEQAECKYVMMDEVPPTKPVVDDTGILPYYPEYHYRTTELRVRWSATDADSGIDYYLVTLRSGSNFTIVEWTQRTEEDEWITFSRSDPGWIVDPDTSSKMYLQNGSSYFFFVKAVDKSGFQSLVGFSNGIMIDTSKKPDHCLDGSRNAGETDVDCGGSECPPCWVTQSCNWDSDCTTGFCNPGDHTCKIPRCDDTIKNGDETGVDCGGSCPLNCAINQECIIDADCTSGICDQLTFRCVPIECTIDSECPQGYCDTTTGNCVAVEGCLDDDDCPVGICDDATHECVYTAVCSSDADCEVGMCDPTTRRCVIVEECYFDLECTNGVCDLTINKCVEVEQCYTDRDCPNGLCDQTTNQCVSPVECYNDWDCDVGVCDETTNQCVMIEECYTDSDCDEGVCDTTTNQCVVPIECYSNADCTSGVCDLTTNQCIVVPDCYTDADCYGGVCDETTNQCVAVPECYTDADCPNGVCELTTNQCVLIAECNDDLDCDVGVCDTTTNQCVVPIECYTDADCIDGICDQTTNQCVVVIGCYTNADCINGICDQTTNQCISVVECSVNSDCTEGICDIATNKCVAGVCYSDADCITGICDLSINQCVEIYDCYTDLDCIDGVCDETTNQCVEAYECFTDFDCMDGVCDETTNECVEIYECLNDADCPVGVCDQTTNQCVIPLLCYSDLDCPVGVCDETINQCVQPYECYTDAECPVGVCDLTINQCVQPSECNSDSDCLIGLCDETTHQCIEIHECTTDFDCTIGVCDETTNQCVVLAECFSDADCDSGVCDETTNQCVAIEECTTDADCDSGVCDDTIHQCVVLAECTTDSDCDSGICDETTNQCIAVAGCTIDADCDVGVCDTTTNQCVAIEECATDADCDEGVCDETNNQCVVVSVCDTDADCTIGVCDEGVCVIQEDSCSNGIWDLDTESDVDCGGICRDLCEVGHGCDYDEDCISGKCSPDNICQEPTCFDILKNGDETDIDCGGSCQACQNGNDCLTDFDCVSETCEFNVCSGSKDENGNGIPDSWEEEYCGGECEPDEDYDGDKLTNLQEYFFGTDPENKDTDGDGATDYEEYQAGTDPNDPDDKPKSSFFKWFLILLVLILLGLGGYVYYQKTQEQAAKAGAAPGAKPAPTIKLPPRKRPMTKQEAISRIDAIKKRKQAKQQKRGDAFTPFEKKPKSLGPVPKPTAGEKKEKAVPKKPTLGKKAPAKTADKGDVWNRLTKLTDEELKKTGKTGKDVHAQLADLYGKRLDTSADKKLSAIVIKDQITKSNIVDVFTELAKEKNLSKGVLKNILSKMVNQKKITKVEVKGVLEHLSDSKAITKADVSNILSYIVKK